MSDSNHTLDFLINKDLVQQTLIRVGIYCDQKRWEEHRKLFMDEVTIDFGGVKPSQVMKADDLKEWGIRAYALVDTQHMFTNQDISINGSSATATSYGRALHKRKDNGESWMIYNQYEHSLVKTSEGWKVSRLKMEVFCQTGNEKLLEETFAASGS